jgi:GAF domain-containing protein
MVALTVPLDEMEAAIDQIRLDRALTAEVAHSIYSENDWKAALKTTAEQMCQRLNVDRFLVVVHDRDLGQFEVCYQNYPSQRRPLPSTLEMLNEADWSLLEKSSGAVAIENLDGELQHLTWRDRLLELGVRSVLLCSTSIGHALEGIVLLCQETPRTWNALERELLKVVSQQIGLMLHQWQLQQQADQQQKISQTLQWGLTTIQHTHQLDLLERSALQNLTQVLQVPMAALVAWSPGRDAGRVMTSGAGTERFTLNTSMTIPVNTDPLVQWALESDELISVTIGEIATETRQWLTGTGIGQVLAMALRTAADHAPTGIILVLEGSDRRWSERHLSAFRTVVSQIAWSRRSVMLTAMLATQREELERLNWYKHRRLEDAYRSLSTHLRRLLEVGNLKDALAGTRQQQIVRQINDAIVPLAQLIQEEPWRLRLYSQTMPLVTLLKRSLERVDGLIKQRQLWSQVHNEVNPTISGDITKIELVLYELLLASCLRSEVGARLDIWCRQVDAQWLELSITDSGRIDPRLIADLEMGRSLDLLAASTLNQPPGLHLMICQTLMKQMGGECTLFKLEDDRILSRLMLPILQNQ